MPCRPTHSFGDLKRTPFQLEAFGIERLCEDVCLSNEQQMAVRIHPTAIGIHEALRRRSIELADVNPSRGRRTGHVKQEVPPVGKEVGEGVSNLAAVEPRRFNGRTALCGYPHDRARWIANKENDPVTAPCPAHAHNGFCQDADQAAIEIEPLEQPVRIKRNGTAIGRPERKPRAAGPGQRVR